MYDTKMSLTECDNMPKTLSSSKEQKQRWGKHQESWKVLGMLKEDKLEEKSTLTSLTNYLKKKKHFLDELVFVQIWWK